MRLLVEPPLSIDEWAKCKLGDRRFQRLFGEYCHQYARTALRLPHHQLRKIWWELARELRHCDVGPELLHVIVERELKESEFEPSSKVAKLVVLSALVERITKRGIALSANTQQLLHQCRELVPSVLLLAVHDHFGLMPNV